MKIKSIIVAIFLILPAQGAFAVQPDEILADQALEARAREISKGLRCLVCRNESIDESNADLARDLRILLRERLVAGDSDSEAVDYIVGRFGEYVLLTPTTTGANKILWWTGPILLFFAIFGAGVYARGRSKSAEQKIDELSEEERARLQKIIDS